MDLWFGSWILIFQNTDSLNLFWNRILSLFGANSFLASLLVIKNYFLRRWYVQFALVEIISVLQRIRIPFRFDWFLLLTGLALHLKHWCVLVNSVIEHTKVNHRRLRNLYIVIIYLLSILLKRILGETRPRSAWISMLGMEALFSLCHLPFIFLNLLLLRLQDLVHVRVIGSRHFVYQIWFMKWLN
jgi:hypothetical protein